MTRHQRRKLAKKLASDHNERLLKADLAFQRALIVKRNLSKPPERNYYPQSQIGSLGDTAPRFSSSGRGPGAMSHRSAQAFKAQGKW